MTQLRSLQIRLGNVDDQDDLLKLLLQDAEEMICDIRNSDIVEEKYLSVQVRIAVELYNKMGAEGQVGHTENGLSRTYEKGDVSDSLMSLITPVVRTPYGEVRVIE